MGGACPFPVRFPDLKGPDKYGHYWCYVTVNNVQRTVYYKFETESIEDMEWAWTVIEDDPHRERWTRIVNQVANNESDYKVPDGAQREHIEFLKTSPIPPNLYHETFFEDLHKQVEILSRDDRARNIPDDQWLVNRGDLGCFYADKKKKCAGTTQYHPSLVIFRDTPRFSEDIVYVLDLVEKKKDNKTKIRLRVAVWGDFRSDNYRGWVTYSKQQYAMQNTLSDCAKWCLVYHNKHPNYGSLRNNCQQFMTALLEFLKLDIPKFKERRSKIAPERAPNGCSQA